MNESAKVFERVERIVDNLRDTAKALLAAGEVIRARLDQEAAANSDAARQVEH
jgi:hypothetical protein